MSATVETSPTLLPEFVTRWAASAASERANYQLFLSELCDVLGVPRPNPSVSDVSQNVYVFERDVKFQNTDGTTSDGRIDLYKRGCFVLEAKQGVETPNGNGELTLSSTPKRLKRGHGVRGTKAWDDAMVKARGQAELYAKALPVDEGWPPFLIVVDVGHSIELYADFTRSGKTYLQHPDPKSFRILLSDLVKPELQELLRTVWTDPLSLDPTRRSAKVTRELADRLALLAKSLEKSNFEPGRVAQFLMRCLFTMFAEDVELIPRDSFKELLKGLKTKPEKFSDRVRSLWESMDKGTYHPVIDEKLRRFNGGLFEDCEALPLTADQLELLIEASQSDWRDVEPAIFGTLLERALDPTERHKLGAHYTPRAYVERLVMPTIIEPLRDDWDAVRAAALVQANRGERDEAIKTLREFLEQLCQTRVLDPACGSGNFLYVALEHMKRLEGEVLSTLGELGYKQRELLTVDPHQFLGIEVNPRAAAIVDLVLWIGYLQWHTRTRRLDDIAEPIIQKFHNIDCRDAVLAWDRVEEVKDDQGNPVTRWDGRTMKQHPVTGEDVPDDTARVPVLKYINPRKAEWPEAEFIVGNPPFLGDKIMKTALGSGYVEAIRSTYPEGGGASDFVMYWWIKAGALAKADKIRRFGFIATNSLRQNFNRRAIEPLVSNEGGLSLTFAIPDHPWIDSSDGASVRISMTVGCPGNCEGILLELATELEGDEAATVTFNTSKGKILANLTIGADVPSVIALAANRGISCPGVKLFGQGFVLDPEEVQTKRLRSTGALRRVVRPYLTAREVAQTPKDRFVIDLLGLSTEEAQQNFPALFQLITDRVKPERLTNNRESYRRNWWVFGEPRRTFRVALDGLARQIITPETSKHRFFLFLDSDVIAEGTLIVIAADDAYTFGVLSSRIHETWALAAGSRLGVGNDPRYNKSKCFDPYPFPVATENQQARIRELGEQLDAHRKKQQSLHPELTLTGMYNVLEKLRSGEPLTAKEKTIHEQGLVSVLKQIHDDLDAAVFEAYGWPSTLTDEEILARLVALNAERAEEEQRGLVRWLRPEFQNPGGGTGVQKTLEVEEDEEETPKKSKKPKTAKPQGKRAWPKKLADQAQAVAAVLQGATKPVTPAELAKSFTRANVEQLTELLETLVSLGRAREVTSGRFAAA